MSRKRTSSLRMQKHTSCTIHVSDLISVSSSLYVLYKLLQVYSCYLISPIFVHVYLLYSTKNASVVVKACGARIITV